IISTIYMNCIRALRETVGEVDDKFNYRYQQIFDAVQYDERTVIKKELISFCEDTMQVILQNRAQTKNSLILDSMEYLKENFSDPDLTLQSISSYLNVKSIILCKIVDNVMNAGCSIIQQSNEALIMSFGLLVL